MGWRQKEMEIEQVNKYDLMNKITELDNMVNELNNEKLILHTQIEAVKNELNAIYESNAWKLSQKMKHNKVLRWSGKKVINFYKKLKNKSQLQISPIDNIQNEGVKDSIVDSFVAQLVANNEFDTIAITHKNWLGVKNSTKELYNTVIEAEELNNYQQVIELGNAIINKGIKKVVFSGFASGWNTLCSYIKENAPEIRIIVFWHGNTTHMYEDYSWVRYQEILQLSKDKHIDRIAFAKESMCRVYEHLGLDVGLVKNYVEKRTMNKLKNLNDKFNIDKPIRIGIYSSGGTWNKNAYTQIAAASLFKDATVSMVPYNERMQIFATQLGLKVSGFMGNVNREELLKEMEKNDINFYITFSECAPLVPLESLNNGVICLTGNNHHYFKGSELEDFLVVDRPDDAVAIYNKALEALKNKDRILEFYTEWYEKNRVEAIESAKYI